MGVSDGESPGFLSRWSRRKAAAREGTALPEPPRDLHAEATPTAQAAAAPVPPPAAAADPAPPEPPTLDDVAPLTPQSDFRRFVAPEVDAQVRNAALKKLFADPHFNVMDGLDVYIDDYGRPDPLPEGMLRQLAQSAFLGAAPQPAPDRGESAVAENRAPAPGLPSSPEPRNDQTSHADEDPAVRLQPDDAARSDGDRPRAVDDPRREC